MPIVDVVKTVYSKYFQFQGRSDRGEFWWFVLFYFAAIVVLSILDNVLGTGGILGSLFVLGTILPYLGVSVRRLHDTGKSGWWVLLGLIPIVGLIVLIIFYAKVGDPGDNIYGPKPAGAAPTPTL